MPRKKALVSPSQSDGISEVKSPIPEEPEVEPVDPDTLIEGVPPVPEQIPRPEQLEKRDAAVFKVASNEGKYLDKEVWPTLQPALVKLLEAIKWNIPKHIRQQYQDPTMRRTLHPEHADFNPVHWLATFLKEHNPNKPSRLSPDQAAVVLQTAVRGRNARRRVADMRTARENKIAQDIEDARRHAAAVKVQAAYRGHSVRLALSMGRLTDLRSW